jgi:hypothetical protein
MFLQHDDSAAVSVEPSLRHRVGIAEQADEKRTKKPKPASAAASAGKTSAAGRKHYQMQKMKLSLGTPTLASRATSADKIDKRCCGSRSS